MMTSNSAACSFMYTAASMKSWGGGGDGGSLEAAPPPLSAPPLTSVTRGSSKAVAIVVPKSAESRQAERAVQQLAPQQRSGRGDSGGARTLLGHVDDHLVDLAHDDLCGKGKSGRAAVAASPPPHHLTFSIDSCLTSSRKTPPSPAPTIRTAFGFGCARTGRCTIISWYANSSRSVS